MTRSGRTLLRAVVSLALGLAVATALAEPGGRGPASMHHGMGAPAIHGMGAAGMHGPMGGPMTGHMRHDAAFAADMALVHELLVNHHKIRRTVTNLPDGIRTVTESDDPRVAQAIKAHVASMSQRLSEGRDFNMFSTTLPVLFENRARISSTVETTDSGSIVTRTSGDARVVAALQAHAMEVSELARDGMAAMMRSARAGMAGMGHGAGGPPRAAPARSRGPASGHVH